MVVVPFSHSPLLLVGQRVLPEWQHHKLGAIYEHHSATILWIYPHDRNMYILYKTILEMKTKGQTD